MNSSATADARRNVALLAACQAMLLTTSATLIVINGLAGLSLAPYSALATLPITCWILGSAIATVPASLHMKRAGRRRGLMTGVLWSVAGALLCAAAMWTRNFWLLCLGTLVWGVHNAYGQYYRFAAADAAPAEFKATAISLVLAGGLVGGIVGPTASRLTVELLASRFMGAYLSLILVALVTLALLALLHIAPPSASEQSARGRPLAEIAAQPKFIIAVMSAAIGYGVMNFLMTSTPIAMQVCGHPYADAAFVISSHVVGMFAPSFFTGPVIKRIGALPVMFAGALANFAAIGVALSGVSVLQFWWSLVLLGVGWNFLYIGGTTLLTETYRPEERAKAQGANEQAIFLMMIASSVTSGVTVTAAGWERVNLLALPLVAAVALAIGWFAVQERARKAAAA